MYIKGLLVHELGKSSGWTFLGNLPPLLVVVGSPEVANFLGRPRGSLLETFLKRIVVLQFLL